MLKVTEAEIRRRSSPDSFARGHRYYKSGAISATRQIGPVLEARCRGSAPAPYRVRVVLDEHGGVSSTSCTCPYDWGGDCKHIVALLLTYMHEPEQFEQQATLADKLADHSHTELVTLIEQMVARYPDLRILVDRPTPADHEAGQPVDTEPFRRELREAVAALYDPWSEDEWDDGYDIDHDPAFAVFSVAAAAQQFAARGDWRAAGRIYGAVIDECLSEEYLLEGEEHIYLEALDEVIGKIVTCLDQAVVASDAVERNYLLDRLLDAYIWNVDAGGVGLGEGFLPDAIVDHAQPEDWLVIRERLLEGIAHYSTLDYRRWAVDQFASVLLEFDRAGEVDPEETLEWLDGHGLHRQRFALLMDLGRVDEAIAVAAESLTSPDEQMSIVRDLTATGHHDLAVTLARKSLGRAFNDRLADWLAGRYEERGDRQGLFELWLYAMSVSPSLAYYLALRDAAPDKAVWAAVRAEITEKLEQESQLELLIRICLADKEWDKAWTAYLSFKKQVQSGPYDDRYRFVLLEREAVQALEHIHPEQAIPLIVDAARQEIAYKNRAHYAEAAVLLARVRDLYRGLGDESSWQDLISGLRTEFARLRALQDELDQAGL